MNPALMWVQAICLALACALLGLTPAHLAASILAALLAVHWVAMNATYAAALAGSGRSSGVDGQADRRRHDRHVAAQAVGAVAVGAVAGIGGSWLQDSWLWHDRELLTVCAGALGALAWTIYASSLVDWYYIRPRLDGIVREPPCRTSGDEAWGNLSRLWYLHRALAEILGIVAVIAAFSTFVGGMIAGTGTLPTAAAVALPTGAAGALVLLTQSAIATLRDRAMTRPWIWVGDELRADDWQAFVLQLGTRGVIVREWDADEMCWGREREITHERLERERIRPGRFDGCRSCRRVNPTCEWEATDRAAELPRRWLVG
jgi:hypothetical protein